MAGCPSDETVALFLEGALEEARALRLRHHLDSCTACRAVLADVVRVEDDARAPAASVGIGDVLSNKYLIEKLLGAGGMGAVFRGRHIELERPVAIKTMHRAFARDPDAVRRVAREARAAAALTSPNAVRVLDIDRTSGGAPYIVMELLDGSDLGTIVAKDGPLPLEQVLDVALQVCSALIEAHAVGIIHRDLKPSNLLLTRDGTVKVVDFGLAKYVALAGVRNESSHTRTRSLLGSPQYMAPEQIRSPKDVDTRADIWGMGTTLYHLLAGVVPFAGTTLYTLCSQILHEPPVPLEQLRPDLPESLAGVVMKCLSKAPSDRYGSVADLATALRAVDEARGESMSLGSSLESGRTLEAAPPTERMATSAVTRGEGATEPRAETLLEDDNTPRRTSRPHHEALVLALRRDAPTRLPTQWMLRGVSRVTVGRGDDEPSLTRRGTALELKVDDPHLSSQHFALERSGDRWQLEDLRSTNGTVVNGQRRSRAWLTDRDVVEAGRGLYLLRSLEGPPALEPVLSLSSEDGLQSLAPATQAVFRALLQLAPTRLTLVLEGEVGTGKKAIARRIHQLSGRSGPFVPVDCTALTAESAQHVPGLLRAANGGTLFLDEIGHLPLALQDRLFRVANDRQLLVSDHPLPIAVDVRLVIATTTPLRTLMDQARIREDLQARVPLSVARLQPLRDRIEDVGLMVRSLLVEDAAGDGLALSATAARAIFTYPWPGNIRELKSTLHAALALWAGTEPLRIQELPEALRDVVRLEEEESLSSC